MKTFKIKSALVLALLCSASSSAAQSGTFTATGNMTTARSGHTAVLLTNGKVLITGGSGPTFVNPASAELYDPKSRTFTRTGDMITPRAFHTATLLPDGRVLIAGGYHPTGNGGGPSAELYDPASGTFAPTGNMSGGYFRAALLTSGKVLLADPAVLYDPSGATFTTVGPLPVTAGQLTPLADGKVLIQGYDEAGFVSVALYDPQTGVATLNGGPVKENWMIHTATLLTTGKVLNTMTVSEDGYPTDIALLCDPSTGRFAPLRMSAIRRNATATVLPDATVLIAGGGSVTSPIFETNSAELYNPVADKFSPTGSMTENRQGHTATLLPDGTVLLAGGGLGARGTFGAEIYHPNVLIPAPVLFSLPDDGRGQGVIWHGQSGQLASAGNPAVAGEILSTYTTSLVDGGVIPPQIAIGSQLAEVLYFGGSGYPGYNQVNFRMPNGVMPGTAVPVRLNYLGRPSNEVTIGVR